MSRIYLYRTGYLADKYSVVGFNLPTGVPFTYIHLLTILTTFGIGVAICLICIIPMPGQKKLRDAVPFIMDIRFLPNIIRAQVLAHSSNPGLFVWALSGFRGRSAQIAIKEIQDKISDAYPDVRKAAFNTMSQISPDLIKHENLETFPVQQFLVNCPNAKVWMDAYNKGTLGKAVEQVCRLQQAKIMEILELYGQIDSLALRKEIALGLANGIQNHRAFYKILTRETVVPGSCFTKLVSNLRKVTHKLPIAREITGEIINKIEEDFHAANYPAVLRGCCDLNKNMTSSANLENSTLPNIITKLCSIAESRAQKEYSHVEMLLGLFLTLRQFDKGLNYCNQSASDVVASVDCR